MREKTTTMYYVCIHGHTLTFRCIEAFFPNPYAFGRMVNLQFAFVS